MFHRHGMLSLAVFLWSGIALAQDVVLRPQIIGGTEVLDKTSFVYQHTVRLLIDTRFPAVGVPASVAGKSLSWRCSGALAHEKVVVTAAHCFPASMVVVGDDGKAIRVPVPSLNVEVFYGLSPRDSGPWGTRGEIIVRHPGYSDDWIEDFTDVWNPAQAVDDVALVSLSRPVPQDKKPVSLLGPETTITTVDALILAGYGRSLAEEPFSIPVLREVTVPYMRPLRNQTDFVVGRGTFDPPREIPNPQGACSGDSGGPAYLIRDGVARLAGVIVRGPDSENGGCAAGVSIVTDVRAYFDWLEDNVAELASE